METKQHATKKTNVSTTKSKYLQRNENENTTLHNLWDIAKAVIRGKCIAI